MQLNLQQRFSQLTNREYEVLGYIVDGLATKAIAAKLKLSVRTIDVHRANIMRKSQAKNVAELTRLSILADVKTPQLND